MSPTRIEPKLQSIELDLATAFSFEHGFGRSMLLEFWPQLEEARYRLLSGADVAAASAIEEPERMLFEYRRSRRESLLGRILTIAKRLREAVDTVVALGPAQLLAAAEALLAACGHPLHNQLSRGQRGGRPQIHFVPALPDNDAVQGLLDILPRGRILQSVDERWGLLAIDWPALENGRPGELIAGLFLLLWDALQSTSTATDEARLAVAVAPEESALARLANQIGIQSLNCESISSSAFFSPGVLLAASVMGLDIVKLLRGAAAMSQRFASAPPGNNPALDFAGLQHLLKLRRGIDEHMIDPGGDALARLARHFHKSLPRSEHLLIQWLSQSVRTDRLRVTMPIGGECADRKQRRERFLTDIVDENARVARDARSAAGQPTVVVHLSSIDESSVGQLIQLHVIAASIERILKPATPNPEP